MDMFKLLTRSTNLQRSAAAPGNSIQQPIPSAGFHGFRDPDVAPETNTKEEEVPVRNGTKRKRDETKIEHVPEYLDFFNDADKDKFNHVPSPGGMSLKPSGSQPQLVIRNKQPKSEAPRLSEEERRKVLKQHKLRITVLSSGNSPISKRKKASEKDERLQLSSPSDDGVTQLTPHPLTSFGELRSKYKISRRLSDNLDHEGYTQPTEVQMGSLPILLGSDQDRGFSQRRTGKKEREQSTVDLLSVAPTGSGKTLAFLIHLIHGLLRDSRSQRAKDSRWGRKHEVRALVVAPTHELADQITNEGRKLVVGTGLKISGMRKGMRIYEPQQGSSSPGPADSGGSSTSEHTIASPGSTTAKVVKADILVSTPLMLLNSISSTSTASLATLPDIRYLVLDEADILLDPLFRTQTLGIWSACTNQTLQTTLWSATIGSSIESLAVSFINDRRRDLKIPPSPTETPHRILRLVVGLKDSAVHNISHRLIYAATEQGKLLALRQLLHPTTASSEDGLSMQPPFLIFTQTIPRAIALHSELLYDIPPQAGGSTRIAVLHSDLSDTARSAIMARFRTGDVWILITTDLLSRGVDFRGVNGVVNYDIPNTSASYVHRVGRTGRQGRQGGVAITLYTKEDIPYVKNIANVIAASERAAKGKYTYSSSGSATRPAMAEWLLDALPAVSRQTRRELKTKGVAGRRAGVQREEARRMRISTKSGYDRQREHRRKGAAAGQRRRAVEGEVGARMDDDEEWEGIAD